jgi:MFS family permease
VDTGDCSFEPESNTYFRNLFDSFFFLGWMWSVPLFGWLADYKGRRWALFGSWAVLMISTVACALATTPTMYLVARHFNGVGWGSQSLSAYVLGTEIVPKSTATAAKTYWGAASSMGQVAVALVMRSMLAIPNYNWRLATLLSILPIFLLGVVAIFTMDESPRWVLISHGEAEAKQLLRKVALQNGGGSYLAELDRMSLRVPEQPKSGEAAYQMFCTKGLIWRIVAVCTLWFSSGFSFYGLTLGVNALPFDRYYITAIISTVEIPARALNRPLLASPLGTSLWTNSPLHLGHALFDHVPSTQVDCEAVAVFISLL